MEPWTTGSAPLRRPEVGVRDREGLVDLGVGVGMVVSAIPEGVNILSCCGNLGSGGPVSVDGSAIMS